ncbi:phage portal protein [Kitasatospora sp. CB02891]|uniref:phage portal protein n=1 Tax=Kitasatospora sp. CB02891 TaxID=2020329 RepID=UPI000C274DB2|nr:phage portal protein [Kitasatospora sp. CB02891]PJN22414.1 phage portal protein [Kitasatospora sp. CB02891]
MSILRRAFERRAVTQWGDSSIPTNGSLSGLSAAGMPVTDQTAMQLAAVWACVRILSTAVSSLPIAAMRPQGGITVPVPDQPAIVADPFGGANDLRRLSRRAGFQQLAVSLGLRGNAYALVTSRDWLFRPTRLMVLHPDRVKVDWDDDGERCYRVDNEPVENPADMVHLMGMCLPGAPTAMSPISYARHCIGLGLAAQLFGGKFFEKGAHLSGVITVDADLDRAKARQMKEAFEASHSGMASAHSIGILSGGAKWQSISVTPEDAQFLGTKAAATLDVAMLYGVPPHMLGQVDRTTSWGTGIEEQGIGFLTYTLEPLIGVVEDAWTAMLPRGTSARMDTTALQRTNTSGRYAAYTQARTSGILTINESRAKENLPPVPGGDDIFAPLNSAHSGASSPGAPAPAPSTEE